MTERNRQPDRRFTRALAWGMGISIVLHALLFLVFSGRPLPRSPFAAAGERMGDVRAAAGGGLEAIQLATPQRVPEPPQPVPEPTPEPTEVTLPEPQLEEDIPAIGLENTIASPGSQGPAEGPGLAEGTGLGDGGTEAEGRFRVFPPRPKGMPMPPNEPPDDIRGKKIEVWVYVTATGRVVPDSTRLNPPTGDRGFDRRLRERAAEWVFEPARRDGRAVGGWYAWTLEISR